MENLHLQYSGTLNPLAKGDATVTYTVRNTGNVILAARQAVSVAGPFGIGRVSADAIDESPMLQSGETWTVSVPVPAVAPADTESSAQTWAMPRTLLALLVAVAALIAFGFISRRRCRRLAAIREDARVQSAVEQAMLERETSNQG